MHNTLIVKILLTFSVFLALGGCALVPPESGRALPDRASSASASSAGYHYMLGVLAAMDGRLDDAI